MKFMFGFWLINFSLNSFASGCMHYEEFLEVYKITPKKNLTKKEFRVVSSSDIHYSIKLNSSPDKIYTLVKRSSEATNDAYLEIKDIIFEQGHGCGPIYRCETGYLRLKNKKGTFTWPVIEEYSSRWGDPTWIVETLLPVFGQTMDFKHSGGIAQCEYGDW